MIYRYNDIRFWSLISLSLLSYYDIHGQIKDDTKKR